MYRRSTWLRSAEGDVIDGNEETTATDEERLAAENVRAAEARAAAEAKPAAVQTGAPKSYKREGYERRIDDAHAVIPFIFGAFRHPSRNGYRIGLPLLEYAGPEINLNTGQWKYRSTDAMDTVKRAMRATNRDILDLLVLVKRKDVLITPLQQILASIDSIEKTIRSKLSAHRDKIVGNHTAFREHILKTITDGLGKFDDEESLKELKAELRSAVMHEHEMEVNATEKLYLKGGVGLTMDSFSGADSLDDILKLFQNTDGKAEMVKLMRSQETEKLSSIEYNIKSVEEIYNKIITVLESGKTSDFLDTLRKALVKSGKENQVDRSQTSQQDKIIREFLEHLVMERVELLYGHVYTYFSAMIGKHHEEINKLTKDFMGVAVLSIMQPLLEVEFRDHVLLDEFYKESPDVKDPVANVLHAVQRSGSAFFVTYRDAIFNVKPTVLKYDTDPKATLAVITQINDSIWKRETPAGLNGRVKLNNLHIEPTLRAFRDIVDHLKKISDDVKSVFNEYKVPQQTFLHRTQLTVDPAKDALFNVLQQSVDSSGQYRFSFSILSHAILFDQRVNPSFAAHFILKYDSDIERSSAAHWYFTKTKNLFAKATHTYKTGHEASLQKIGWTDFTTDRASILTANPIISGLKLKNVDAITPLTQPIRPKSAAKKSSQKKKGDTKPKTPAQSTRESVKKKGGVTVGKKNHKAKTDKKKK